MADPSDPKEYPCNRCARDEKLSQNRRQCVYSNEDDWDWSTDMICPGRIAE